jgi:GTP-binding protein EngB required for normal cell division
MALAAFNKAAEGAGAEADKYVHVSEEVCLAGGAIGKAVEVSEQVYDVVKEFQAHGLTKKALGNALGSHRHSLGAYNRAIENHGRSIVAMFAEKGVGMASTALSSALVKSTMAKGAQKVVSSGTQSAAHAAQKVVSTSMVTQAVGRFAGALSLVNVGLGLANIAVGVHNGYHIRKMRGEVREVSTKIDTMRGEMDAGFSEMNMHMFEGFDETNANINSLGDFLGGELDALGYVLELQTYQLEVLTDDSLRNGRRHLRTHEMLRALARRMDAGFEDTKQEIATQFTRHEMYTHWFRLKEYETALIHRFKECSAQLPVPSVQALSDLKGAATTLMDQVRTQFTANKHLGNHGDPRRVHLVAHFVFAARTEQDAFLLEGSPPSSAASDGTDSSGSFPPFTGDGDDLEAFADWFVRVCQDPQLKRPASDEKCKIYRENILNAEVDKDTAVGKKESDLKDVVKKDIGVQSVPLADHLMAAFKVLKEDTQQEAAPPPAPTQHSIKHLDEALQYIRDEVHGICEACEFNLFKLATDYRPYLQQYLALALGIKEGLALDEMGWDDAEVEAQTGEGKQEDEEWEEEEVVALLAKYEEQGALQLRQERTRMTFQKAVTIFDVRDDALIEQMSSKGKLAELITNHAYTLAETAHPCLHLDLYSELCGLFGKKDAGLWAPFASHQQKVGVPFSDMVYAHAETNEMRYVVSFLDRYPSAIRKVEDRETVYVIVQAVLGSAQAESQHVADQSMLLRRLVHADGRNRIMECIVGDERLLMLPQYIVFCGNSGTGKSTWLNGICGKELFFKSGFSAGSGLTQAVQTKGAIIPFEGQQFKIIAGDTPGLNDAKTQEQCGEEIRKALEKSKEFGNALRLIFFFTLESGRVDPDDVATMQTVLGAIKSSTDMTNQFGVVINKIPELEYEWIMEEQVKQAEILSCVFPPGTTKSAHVYWNAQDQPMATAALRAQRARESGRPVSAAPTIPQGQSVEKLRDFTMKLPPMRIEKVEKLETDKLNELREEMKKRVEAIEAENAKERWRLERELVEERKNATK